jgi:SPP1 family predicted phage head-tail adaptor
MNTTSPADLNKRVSLQSETTANDAMGSPVSTWVTVAKVWAKKTTHRSDEAVKAMAESGTAMHNYRIRYRPDVLGLSSGRILHGGKYMAIIGPPVEKWENAMHYLDITVRESA